MSYTKKFCIDLYMETENEQTIRIVGSEAFLSDYTMSVISKTGQTTDIQLSDDDLGALVDMLQSMRKI